MTPGHTELPSFPFDAETALAPPAEWAEFREKCPVAHVRLASGDEAALITGKSGRLIDSDRERVKQPKTRIEKARDKDQ